MATPVASGQATDSAGSAGLSKEPTPLIRPANPHTSSRVVRAGIGVIAAVCVSGLATPAQAKELKPPVRDFTVTCAEPDDVAEFGAAVVQLTFKRNLLRKDDFFVVVPVNDATGLDAGERVSVDRKQRYATVVLPADGSALTPAATVEVRLGGDVVQRVRLPAGCGVLDPDPAQGPAIGQITSGAGTVTVRVTNVNDVTDEIGVTLFPAGGTSGDTSFLRLAPGETRTVTFTGVTAGQYVVEAFGYTTFTQSNSEPFSVD